jgi:2-phosphosulfolactate phosphatase
MLTPEMTKVVEVAVTPSETRAIEADCFIVVDVLRATTTIATLFGAGLADLVVVDDLREARRRAAEEHRILFGEVGGLPPEGFDHGNSPVEAAALSVAGAGAQLFTTNGTAALCALAGRGVVLAGAPANCGAIVVAAAAYERVVVVCAGSDGGARFALDDFAAAGTLTAAFLAAAPAAIPGDAARLAVDVVRDSVGLARVLSESRHGRILRRLGLADDIAFSARIDTSTAVPMVVDHGPGWARLENAGAR